MGRAAEWIATVPWCITAEALEAMIAIAERTPLDDTAERMHGPKSLAFRTGSSRDDTPRVTMRDHVAVLRIDGPIYRYADVFTEVSGGQTTESIALDFQALVTDPRVEAILLVIDSPGGEATGIGELSSAIAATRGRKPIGAYIEGYGASAAYWIASAADWVWVDPSALVGSIGTVLGLPNPAAGPQPPRRIEIVSSQSPKKRADPTTQGGRAYLQQIADAMTEVFIDAVAAHRGLTRDQVVATEGGLLVGQHAIDAGLADALGTEEGAIVALTQQAVAPRPALGAPRRTAARQEDRMDWKQFWAGFWGGAQEAGATAGVGISDPARVPSPIVAQSLMAAGSAPAPDPERARERAELEALRTQVAAQQEATLAADAAAFATRVIAGSKAIPAQRAALEDAYRKAAAVEGGTTALEAIFGDAPTHKLLGEAVSGEAQLTTLPLARPAAPTEQEQDAQERARARAKATQMNGRTNGRLPHVR